MSTRKIVLEYTSTMKILRIRIINKDGYAVLTAIQVAGTLYVHCALMTVTVILEQINQSSHMLNMTLT